MSIRVGIGVSSFDTDDGDMIIFSTSGGVATATVTMGTADRVSKLRVKAPLNGSGPGTIVELDGADESPVAKMTCRSKTTP